MSLVAISHHNENIHNILEPPKSSLQAIDAVTRRCLYISKFRPKILKEEKKAKDCHKTFGYAQVPLPKPCEFLRKNCRIVPPRPTPARPKCCLTCRRPCVPSAKTEPKPDGKEVKEQTSVVKVCGKNFELENIHKVSQSVPRQPVPKFVDTRKGNSQILIRTGLLPIYIHKKCYGKVPGYILCRKGMVQMKAEPAICQRAPVSEGPVVFPIPQAERLEILEGLRKNWNELQTAYQHMPILIDTMHKRARKDRIEKELRRLELNISTLERHDQIYVIDDMPQ